MTLASILLFGFLIGLRHALEADHVAAVATLATRQKSLGATLVQGAAWGVGHTLTLALVGGLVLALGTTVPDHLAGLLELAVGVMLVLLGADVLVRMARERLHAHVHHHGHEAHIHVHSHARDASHEGHPHAAQSWPTRAVCIGMVHGMAGSAALVLLALERAASVGEGVAFIAVFGAGSIAGMALLSIAIAVPLRATAGRLAAAHGALSAIVGLVTCAVGAQIVAAQLGWATL